MTSFGRRRGAMYDEHRVVPLEGHQQADLFGSGVPHACGSPLNGSWSLEPLRGLCGSPAESCLNYAYVAGYISPDPGLFFSM